MDDANASNISLPTIIQGGMGIGVSDWTLARAVSMSGQLGVVSGTALNTVLIRRLQDGDVLGHIRRALTQCPLREACARIVRSFWVEGGVAKEQAYRLAPLFSVEPSRELMELTIVANFVEVWLAKEGHDGLVGLNLLEKIQLPTLPSLFGAMLAGVDYVLMGAGIPRAIPGVLDGLAQGRKVSLPVHIEGDDVKVAKEMTLDPADFFYGRAVPKLMRPKFLAIISSSTLAVTLARKSSGRVDGFVVEGFVAGGHNAPPRGVMQVNGRGEPVYGPRDIPDIAAIRALGLPFWLAGAYARPEKLSEALKEGASGVQIGSAFAFCDESGLSQEIKSAVLAASALSETELFTDLRASPTGMPFKVVEVEGSVSDPAVYRGRIRICDLGYLRQPYARPDGSVGYRCPAEPEADYVRKGGAPGDTIGRKCLCNGLFSTIGLGQWLAGDSVEPAIVTAGEDVVEARRFLKPGRTSYTVADVLDHLELPVQTPASVV